MIMDINGFKTETERRKTGIQETHLNEWILNYYTIKKP